MLFLLSSNRNGDLKQTLQSFLEFYRQNRELIKMLSSEIKPEAAKAAPPEPESNEKTAPPKQESGSDDLIQEFLRKHATI